MCNYIKQFEHTSIGSPCTWLRSKGCPNFLLAVISQSVLVLGEEVGTTCCALAREHVTGLGVPKVF